MQVMKLKFKLNKFFNYGHYNCGYRRAYALFTPKSQLKCSLKCLRVFFFPRLEDRKPKLWLYAWLTG